MRRSTDPPLLVWPSSHHRLWNCDEIPCVNRLINRRRRRPMRSGAAVENVVVQPRSGIEMRPLHPLLLLLLVGYTWPLDCMSRPDLSIASQPATNSAAAQFFAFNWFGIQTWRNEVGVRGSETEAGSDIEGEKGAEIQTISGKIKVFFRITLTINEWWWGLGRKNKTYADRVDWKSVWYWQQREREQIPFGCWLLPPPIQWPPPSPPTVHPPTLDAWLAGWLRTQVGPGDVSTGGGDGMGQEHTEHGFTNMQYWDIWWLEEI